uniref:DUF3667 domain-containing protein n=1 Tax=Parerythrobacter lutipelagi TaxID=1964208 RepID=UPI0010F8E7BC|nr:DUF3667 domain-containing protein [Parerythrobacter lutipelagi]
MSDITEALGTAVEGALFSRAVDPKTGAADSHAGPPNCLNCGAALTGTYCAVCGQKGQVHRTIGAFMHDLLHGALHFEGKIWKTLPMLLLRPGKLTRRYIDGERAKFVSPMALFLFIVFLMFAVFQALGISTPTEIDRSAGAEAVQVEQAGEQAREATEQQRARLQAELDALAADSPRRAELAAQLDELAMAEDLITGAEQFVLNEGEGVDASFSVSKGTGVGWIDSGLKKWRAHPELMLYKLQSNFYKFSWLLIPLSVPFVWLLFLWKRQFKGYDHAVFVTYSLAFMSLLIIAVTAGGRVGLPAPIVIGSLLLIPPLHLYKQLRGTYGLSRFSTLWRLLLLSSFIGLVLGLFLQLLVLIGLF